jgi:hypothetical protein
VQEEVVSAVTTNDIGKLSKLSFLFANYNALRVLKPTFKIILQHIRVNPSSASLAPEFSELISASDCLPEFIGSFGALSFVLLSFSGKSIGNEELEKLLKLAQDDISTERVHLALAKESSVRFSAFSDYNALKLVQSVVGAIRDNRVGMRSRSVALVLLHRLCKSEFKVEDYAASLLAIMESLLFEGKVTTFEFAVALSSCSSLSIGRSSGEVANQKLMKSLVEQTCTLIYNSS